jgi:hypothetical protein
MTVNRGPAPVPSRPLETLKGSLSSRILNMLLREGFTTVEQVAATPDEVLLKMPLLGLPSITAIRDAIAAAEAAAHVPDGEILLDVDQVRELAVLLSTLAGYAEAREQRDVAHRARTFLGTAVRRNH